MAYQSFEELEVWKRGCRLAVDICQALEACRNFGLRDQMQRAAVSVPSNIAEGYERDSAGDFVRFLRIAKGSAAELRTQLYIAARLGLLQAEQAAAFTSETREIAAMLQGLIRARRASLNLNP
jgi:four helix bundle protein